MNKEEIISKINRFLVDEFEVEESDIQPEADLKETLDLDSLDYVDLVVEIESTFGFKINPDDIKALGTIEEFYNYICSNLQPS